MSDRILYPTAGKGGRSIAGRYVTVTSAGRIHISGDLLADWPGGHPYCRIETNVCRTRLWLRPCEQAVAGSLKLIMPPRGGGSQARAHSQSGITELGLAPKVNTSYTAAWRDGEIDVDLATVFGGVVCDVSPPGPPVRPAQGTIGKLAEQKDPPAIAAKRTKPATCENCGHWQMTKMGFGNCGNTKSTAWGLGRGAACSCSGHEFRQVSEGSLQRARPQRQGSRPRRRCPQCGKLLPVSGKGFMPHDRKGRIFSGGRGDPEDRCDGSNRQPN